MRVTHRVRHAGFRCFSASGAAQQQHAMVSTLDMFSIGIGPSSSHTVGPMRAAKMFANEVSTHCRRVAVSNGGALVVPASALDNKAANENDPLGNVGGVVAELFGSLALTGHGHSTDKAVLLGLMGESPESVDPHTVTSRIQLVETTKHLELLARVNIPFDPAHNLLFHTDRFLPEHSNGMHFSAFDTNGLMITEKDYFSIGGGFVVEPHKNNHENAFFLQDNECQTEDGRRINAGARSPFPFHTAEELLGHCLEEQMSVAQIVMCNELSFTDEATFKERVTRIWHVMDESIRAGCGLNKKTLLPGGLKLRRRAPYIYQHLLAQRANSVSDIPSYNDPDWLACYALAVNEENAAGGRVVTAPTNGAAGIIPAVLKHHLMSSNADRMPVSVQEEIVIEFLCTAAAIGMLFKQGASISAAEVGCQGEVGVAASMAAAALAAVRGGTPLQVENAAEIGMEHHLGLTCDPIKGLVQIPCIERNAMGANAAMTAARLALHGDGRHYVSLDKCIKTMHETGKEMSLKYKETSLGGLAVNVSVPNC